MVECDLSGSFLCNQYVLAIDSLNNTAVCPSGSKYIEVNGRGAEGAPRVPKDCVFHVQ